MLVVCFVLNETKLTSNGAPSVNVGIHVPTGGASERVYMPHVPRVCGDAPESRRNMHFPRLRVVSRSNP